MGVWHPSAAGHCERAQVLQFINTPPSDEQSPHMKEIFEFGHMVHDIVQNRLGKLSAAVRKLGGNYEFTKEVPFDKETDQLYLEMGIGGTCDGIVRIWNLEFEQRSLLEVKSQANSRHTALAKRALTSPTKTAAWHEHLLQSHIYAYRFDLPIIHVFYMNKDNAKRFVHTQPFEQKLFDEAIAYFDKCNDFVARGETPPRKESWLECNECSYRTLCNPEIVRRKQSRKTIPATTLRRR